MKELVRTLWDGANEDTHFFDDKGTLIISDNEAMNYMKRKMCLGSDEPKKGVIVHMFLEEYEDRLRRDKEGENRLRVAEEGDYDLR